MSELDPSELPIDELRARRAELLADDDAVSYVRRLAQARLDLVDAERHRRAATERLDDTGEIPQPNVEPIELADDLPAILGGHLTGGRARPPRPADEASGHPLAIALDDLCARLGSADIASLDDGEIGRLETELRAFERERSAERQAIFVRLDALSAELVRRYREGGVELPTGDG